MQFELYLLLSGRKENTYMSLETAQRAIDIAVHEANKQHDQTLMVIYRRGTSYGI